MDSREHIRSHADTCCQHGCDRGFVVAGDGAMGRSSRLFEIIQFLRHAHGPVSARVIADALEVSKRTVYRDIVTLQAMRVPIEGEAGVGYVMQAGFDLPPLMFTVDEVEAIVVGLSLLGRTGDNDLLAAASRVSRKIADVLPDAADSRIDGSPLHVSHWNEIPPAVVEYRVMRQAIREERKLHLLYRDAEARTTERIVRPIALVYYVDNVMLAAWCELREDFRHFRADRMTACHPIDSVFKGESDLLRAEWRVRHELFSPF
jgi:predicted DNA-binding transcriptional regulator YafY